VSFAPRDGEKDFRQARAPLDAADGRACAFDGLAVFRRRHPGLEDRQAGPVRSVRTIPSVGAGNIGDSATFRVTRFKCRQPQRNAPIFARVESGLGFRWRRVATHARPEVDLAPTVGYVSK